MSRSENKSITSTKSNKRKDTKHNSNNQPTITLEQLLQMTEEYTYVKVIDSVGREVVPLKTAGTMLKTIARKGLNVPVKQITSDVGRMKHNGLSVFVITFTI